MTKRILGALLAVVMVLSAFGAVAASAATAPAGTLEYALPEDGFSLSVSSKAWEWKQVHYLPGGDYATDFFNEITAGTVTWAWTAIWTTDQGVVHNQKIERPNGFTDSKEPSANRLTLSVQPGDAKHFGQFAVSLSITMGGKTVTSRPVNIYLIDGESFDKVVADANDHIANPDNRYTEKYIENLKSALKSANNYKTDADATVEGIELAKTDLQAAINGDGVEKMYQLVGWGFIDNMFSDESLATIWTVIDVVAVPYAWLNDLLGDVDWLTVFSGLISGLTAIIGLAI
ncbi:MAG: hypothetical protein LBB67_07750 [Oscillospiraceae bacterium]|jgi:hypothetical protein|nr:hypothetical protein [Oscillospiraceae bacterium]